MSRTVRGTLLVTLFGGVVTTAAALAQDAYRQQQPDLGQRIVGGIERLFGLDDAYLPEAEPQPAAPRTGSPSHYGHRPAATAPRSSQGIPNRPYSNMYRSTAPSRAPVSRPVGSRAVPVGQPTPVDAQDEPVTVAAPRGAAPSSVSRSLQRRFSNIEDPVAGGQSVQPVPSRPAPRVANQATRPATVIPTPPKPQHPARAPSEELTEEPTEELTEEPTEEPTEDFPSAEPTRTDQPRAADESAAAQVEEDQPTESGDSATTIHQAPPVQPSTTQRSVPRSEAPATSAASRPEAPMQPPVERSRGTFSSSVPVSQPRSAVIDNTASSPALADAVRSPVLAVQTVGPRTIKVGKEGTYTVRLVNAGDLSAEKVVVTVQIPSWVHVVGSDSQAGSSRATTAAGGGAVIWQLDEIQPRQREELVLRLIPREGRSFDLAVQWTHAPPRTETAVVVQEPKLEMEISGAAEVKYGATEVYELRLSNPGTGDAENVLIHLYAPGRDDQPAATHRIGLLKAKSTQTIELELTAHHTGQMAIRAEAEADGQLHTVARHDVLVRRAGLEVALEGTRFQYAGTVANYVVHVTNPGNDEAQNVQVAVGLPAGATFLGGSPGSEIDAAHNRVQWTIGSLPPAGSQILKLQCRLESPGVNRLHALGRAGGGLEQAATFATRVETVADLVLELRDPRGPFPVGQEVTYELVVRNRGTRAAEDVELVAQFSPGLEVTSISSQAELAGNRILFAPLKSVAVGQEIVYQFKARANGAGSHIVGAELQCQPLGVLLTQAATSRFYAPEAVESAAAPTGNRYQDVPAEESAPPLDENEETGVRSMPFESGEPTPLEEDAAR